MPLLPPPGDDTEGEATPPLLAGDAGPSSRTMKNGDFAFNRGLLRW